MDAFSSELTATSRRCLTAVDCSVVCSRQVFVHDMGCCSSCCWVGKVGVEWLASEKTKVVGTFPPKIEKGVD
ncbi:hypothetical protein LWI28_025939 [Acer negundo]|uniref:Uncharacterized protein n=1 Tax=Acer negundo TaxID=4023 RepID=A0AAD5NMC0_ACENE|nr:hypothetical protein LWI28_025939 [Acer negundo]